MNVNRFTTIDEYLALQPEPVRRKLTLIRDTIVKTVPEAGESVSYRIPYFSYHGMVAYFAAFSGHYSIFVQPEVLDSFRSELSEYALSKSGIKIPYSKPVPVILLKEIVKFAAIRNLEKAQLKKNTARKKRK